MGMMINRRRVMGGGSNEDLIDLIERDIVTLNIPNGTTKIGDYAFGYCRSLTSVTIPSSITSIGNNAFQNCNNLTSIDIPDGVTSIGNNAFQNCNNLTSIDIPDGVTSIGNNAFRGCTNLTSLTIGSGVTSIGSTTFIGCAGITSIVVDSTNTVYDSRDNCNAIIKTSTNTLILGCKNTIIPNTVTSIGNYGFYQSGLTNITIPDSVTNIGTEAFYGCSGLASVTVLATTPPISGGAFDGNKAGRKIYVPAESVEAYKTATGWSKYAAAIEAIPT